MSNPAPYVCVYLRGREMPVVIAQASPAHAVATVAFVATTWLRLPPEARPASVWLPCLDMPHVELTEAGVGESVTRVPLAAIDPREVQCVTVG